MEENNKKYAYDIESFPNLFTATFVNVDDESDVEVFVIGHDRNDRDKLISFIKSGFYTLIGYNSISYDDPMLRFLIQYGDYNKPHRIAKNVNDFSNRLIASKEGDTLVRALRYPRGERLWKTIDLMKILAFDKIGVSLKQTSINLKWHTIQDLPLPPTALVNESNVDMVLHYNMNDVLITKRLYEELEPIRTMREELGKIYGVDLSSASDSRIANLILEHTYETQYGKKASSLKNLRTPRPHVRLGDCIADFVAFNDPSLNELLDRISATIVYEHEKYRYSEEIFYAGNTFNLGIGGLHSNDAPGVFVSDEECLIQDMDVTSYYPNLIINNNFYPAHLGQSFIGVLKNLTERRIKAKETGNKVEADGLKITINSIFGKFGFEYFWLYDPKQLISTTLSGQLGMLMLVESLHEKGIEVLSCNTDGIVCKIPREKQELYYQAAKEWEEKTGLILEYTPYRRYIRRDVNNYITQKKDGEVKEKGIFMETIDLKKGYRMPIVAKALKRYFIDDIPIMETLKESKDIMDFCISQRSGSKFQIQYETTNGVEILQKTNRYYVSNNGGALVKYDPTTGKKIGLTVGNYVRVLNKYDKSTRIEEYDINYTYYLSEAEKVIQAIKPAQMSLF